ncbi:ATP-binding protein [Streptomyces sp. NPDC019443]|uniref:ATP-binding protein n=1 Tax=Streptomyces sp. NPDC019443 TaxID=3365061 RepID=UPI0037A0316E
MLAFRGTCRAVTQFCGVKTVRACQAGHRVATAAEWVDKLAAAHESGRLSAELTKFGRYPLIVVDEVGYIPFEAEAANLFFQLISNRYERASVIVTSNKPFGRWKSPCSGLLLLLCVPLRSSGDGVYARRWRGLSV